MPASGVLPLETFAAAGESENLAEYKGVRCR